MLSLAQCRELLGCNCPLPDEQLEVLREQMYELARMAFDVTDEASGPPWKGEVP